MAQANAAKELLFIGSILEELGYDKGDINPVRLNTDN